VSREFATYEFFAAPATLWQGYEAEARRVIEEAQERWPYARDAIAAISSYHAAASSLAPVAAAAYANIWAPTRPIEITHIEVWNTTTTALPQLQLIRSTARGTQTTTTTPTAASNANNPGFMLAPTFVIDTAWSVQPTLVALPMEMPDMAGTVGTSTFWDWGDQDPAQVVNGNGIAFQNASGGTTGIVRVQVRARE
jgi:hypothetical protein